MSIELDEAAVTKRARGPDLYYASAVPSDSRSGMKAMLGILHGYADHGARYRHVMGALVEHGIGSVAIDLRGHGRASGPRGHCERFGDFLDDAREVRWLVEDRAKGAPVFLFGHSFGGLVAMSSIVENAGPYQGLVLSAPLFGRALDVPRIKWLAGTIASRIVPRLGLPSGLSGKDLTHDPARARAYDEDPLVFDNATARWFTETSTAQDMALANAPKLTIPLYVTFGSADRIASMAAAKRVFDAAGSADKTWDPRDGLFHEVLSEPSWKDHVDTIARWVLSRATDRRR